MDNGLPAMADNEHNQQDRILTLRQGWTLPTDPNKTVFVIFLFSGIGGALVALRHHGYHVVQVAFSEIDEACRRVMAARYPQAINLGDVREINLDRFKRLFQDWSKEFKLVLFDDTGSPCQGFTFLSAQRKGLLDVRSELSGGCRQQS